MNTTTDDNATLAMAMVPQDYRSLVITAFCFNVMAVLTSVVVGGLLVEGGQTYGATGRLSSIRMIVANVVMLFVGPLGGFLASRWFGWTAIIGGVLFFTMIPVTLLVLREKLIAKPEGGENPLVGLVHQLKVVFRSRNLWICGGLLFLVHLSPGYSTPLFLLSDQGVAILAAVHRQDQWPGIAYHRRGQHRVHANSADNSSSDSSATGMPLLPASKRKATRDSPHLSAACPELSSPSSTNFSANNRRLRCSREARSAIR